MEEEEVNRSCDFEVVSNYELMLLLSAISKFNKFFELLPFTPVTMLSQFFVVSSRGDCLIFRDFRGDVPRGTPDIFYRRIKSMKDGERTPYFHIEGAQFLYITHTNLYFAFTTLQNVSPVFVYELLNKIASLFKDYCGVLNEESVRKNFTLVYELIDEVMDYGYPQSTSTGTLKDFIFEKAETSVATSKYIDMAGERLFGIDRASALSTAPDKPVIQSSSLSATRNEIYIEILEKLTALVSSTGHMIRSEIDGSVKVKSFLLGTPEINIALSENLLIKSEDNSSRLSTNSVQLEYCSFHDSVQTEAFEKTRTLVFCPPTGEFNAMRYHIIDGVSLPFRIYCAIELLTENEIKLGIKLFCQLPRLKNVINMSVEIPVPKNCSSATYDINRSISSAEFNKQQSKLVWAIRQINGQGEQNGKFNLRLSEVTQASRKDIGPIMLYFECPFYLASNLNVRYIKLLEPSGTHAPKKWTRNVTFTDSYIVRIS